MKHISNLAAILMISLGVTTVAMAERWTVPQCVGAMDLVMRAGGAQPEALEQINLMLKRYFIQQGDFDEPTWQMSKSGGVTGFQVLAETDPNKASAIAKQCRSTLGDAMQLLERAYE